MACSCPTSCHRPRAVTNLTVPSPRSSRRTASRLRWRDMGPPRPGPAASFIVSVIIVTLLRIPSAYRVSQETVGQRTLTLSRFADARGCHGLTSSCGPYPLLFYIISSSSCQTEMPRRANRLTPRGHDRPIAPAIKSDDDTDGSLLAT
jgi:hypothetical protein